MSYTPAQVGAAATPMAHTATADAHEDAHRDETPDQQIAPGVPVTTSRWRAGSMGIGRGSGAGVDASQAALAAEHASVGAPDPRHVWDSGPQGQAGYPLPKQEALNPSPEQLVNARPPVALNPAPAPTRPRAGSTGEDPARPASFPVWLFSRPFDKWAAERLGAGGVEKMEQASPLASTPIQDHADVQNAYPSAGGRWAAGRMNPTGISANTWRLLPRPWDELIVTPSADGAPASGGGPSRGWRSGV